ncbi:MAG: hypothetical protein OXI80_21805 [Caldilineaceae bacterium]|nr:hypothetical protein [Caldilineaceae bacterium]
MKTLFRSRQKFPTNRRNRVLRDYLVPPIVTDVDQKGNFFQGNRI